MCGSVIQRFAGGEKRCNLPIQLNEVFGVRCLSKHRAKYDKILCSRDRSC